MEVKKKALPLHSHLKNGCLRRTRVLKKTGQSEVLSSGLRFENFSKKLKKSLQVQKKALPLQPLIQKGVWDLKMIRGLIQGHRYQIVFWIILRWMQGGRSEERGSYLVVMTDRRTSPTQQPLKRSKKRDLWKDWDLVQEASTEKLKKSRSVNSFGIKSCQGELRII